MAKRYFEFVEGTSSKFWEIWREGGKVYTRYGRIGSDGQVTEKNEGSEAKATKLYDKLVREKTGKGYVEKKAPAAAKKKKAAGENPPKAPKLKRAQLRAPEKKKPEKKKPAKKKPAKKKLEIPELTVESLLEKAQQAAEEQAQRIADMHAGAPGALREQVEIRPSNPVHWGYNFAFDEAIPIEERAELTSFFKRFTKVATERGGFVVMGEKSTPEARREAWEMGVCIDLEQLREQLPPRDVAARTERLMRALAKPDSKVWWEIAMLLSTWEDATLPGAIEAAERELAKWPDAVRTEIDAWKSRPELRRLVRVGWGDVQEIVDGGNLEHLTVLKTQDVEGLVKHQAKLGHIKSLDLSGKTTLAQTIAECPALANLEQLELQQPTYTSGTAKIDLGALLALPHLAKLKALSLYGFELDAKAVEALVDCPQPLERLRLEYGKMKPACGEVLARVAAKKRLVSLDLKYNDLGPKGAQALFARPGDWRALRVLDFSANEIGDRGVAALAKAELVELRWLNISSNDNKEQLTAASAKALASCEALGRLDTLNLYGHPIGAEGVAAVVESPCLRSLRAFCAASASASLADLFAKVGKGEPVPLEELHLGSTERSKKKADWSRATFLSKVKLLNLDSLDGAEYRAALECPHLGALEILILGMDFGGNAEKGLEGMVKATPPPNLHYLNMSGWKFTEAQAKALARSPLGKQLWGLEVMQSYTPPEAWRAFYEAGLPLVNYVMFENNPASEHSPLTTWREEW